MERSSQKRRLFYVDLVRCEVGRSAQVMIKNQGWFNTTAVIEIVPHCDGPVFETKNSFYWPAPTDGSCVAVDYYFKESKRVESV